MKIHTSAIIEDGVELGADVEVGPFSHIRRGAKIGAGTRILSHVSIWGESVIGESNLIYPFCSIGAPPQIHGDESPQGRALIGHRNVLRENVQVHRGSSKAQGQTLVGDDNYLMTSVHIAHDCRLGNKITIASKTGLAGHVQVFDSAIISGACGIAQFVRIGSFTYSAGMSRYLKDLPPFMCMKEFAQVTGPNLVGLQRRGYSEAQRRTVKEIYKAMYIEVGLYKEQLQKLQQRFQGDPIFEVFHDFVKDTKVGIMRSRE